MIEELKRIQHILFDKKMSAELRLTRAHAALELLIREAENE